MNPETAPQRGLRQLVGFRLGDEEFGVDILKVREIVRLTQIARVPQASAAVAGVINLRGNVVPVVDLRRKLGLEGAENDDKTRIIVFLLQDKLVGMIVDRVDRVIRIAESQIEPAPEVGGRKIRDYVLGVGKVGESLLILLNVDRVLSEEDVLSIRDLSQVREAASRPAEAPDASPAGAAEPAPARPKKTAARRKR